jgi:hypothetical protein
LLENIVFRYSLQKEATIVASVRVQCNRLQITKSGAEAEVAVGVRAGTAQTDVEDAGVSPAVPAATTDRQTLACRIEIMLVSAIITTSIVRIKQ